MTVSDYIIKFLVDHGADTVFMVTGGQAMFLNDAVYRKTGIKAVFTHHEQTAGMAAEAYARASGRIGVAMVTAGPGAINVLNGVVGAYVDSASMFVISGQSAYETVSYMKKNRIRQFGLQGINIGPMAKNVTKYFKTVDDPSKIQFYMEEAYYHATNGRPGPVWIEVPLDIQRMEISPKLLTSFKVPPTINKDGSLKKEVGEVVKMIQNSKRPLILAGQGVKLAKAQALFKDVVAKSRIPVVTTRLGIDLINSDSRLFVGRPGLYPDRAANFAIQNADLILVLGARLDVGIVGYLPKDWGRKAKKVVVELDIEELNKPGVNIDFAINTNVNQFLVEILKQLVESQVPSFEDWIILCNSWKSKYPVLLNEYKKGKFVNSYYFTDRLSSFANRDDVIVVDTSSPFHVVSQAWQVKEGQIFLTTGGISTMGYWPSAIGASMATKRRILVVTGDGCLQMNIQELATVSHNKLPIKIFVINNDGYLLIRHTQKTHMEGRLMGESPKTGLWCPDLKLIARAYKIKYVEIMSPLGVDRNIKKVLSSPGPVLCNVRSPMWQLVIPRISSSRQQDGSMVTRPYEDLYPFLDQKELDENMTRVTNIKSVKS